MVLHREVKRVRKEMGLNQKDFAKKLGLSRGHYNRIEMGNNNISIEVLENVASVAEKNLIVTFIDIN